jgi:hypothetical protein
MRSRFTAGGHFSLGATTAITLEGAEFPTPFIISGQSDPVHLPSILSLQRANVTGLVVTGVDLTKCQFANAHGLDKLKVEGSVRFAAPPGRWKWTRRKILAEEQSWRARQPRPRGWSRVEWPEWLARPQRLEPQHIALIYRSLRKGLEDNKDEPGAADLYYGEMEMRRLDRRTPWAERLILWLYWLVSGYGLRGLRALVSLAVVIVGLATLLHAVGFTTRPSPSSFWGSLLYAANSTLSMGDNQVRLTGWGQLLRITLRLAGPVLLGLTLLSVRNRVKR